MSVKCSVKSTCSDICVSSSKERKKHVHLFHMLYNDLCIHQNQVPLPRIRAYKDSNCLDFVADRVKFDEWGPILHALSMDMSLQQLAIRNRFQIAEVLETVNTDVQARAVMNCSVLLTRFMLELVVDAICQCLYNTKVLASFQLEGIPLTKFYFLPITQAISACSSLQYISFQRCSLGDDGCRLLFKAVRKHIKIVCIDVSECNLTHRSGRIVADMIKYQQIHRYSQSWMQTLRYQVFNPNLHAGLRSVCLSFNPIGDAGVKAIADVVHDDIWIKGLELQKCGVTDVGGLVLLKLLQVNKQLVSLDLRHNSQLSQAVYNQVMAQLLENNGGAPRPKAAASKSADKPEKKTGVKVSTSLDTKKPPVSGKPQRVSKPTQPLSRNKSCVGSLQRAGTSQSSNVRKMSLGTGQQPGVSVPLPKPKLQSTPQSRESEDPPAPPSSQVGLDLAVSNDIKEHLQELAEELRKQRAMCKNSENHPGNNGLGRGYVPIAEATINVILKSFEQFGNFLDVIRDTNTMSGDRAQIEAGQGLSLPGMSSMEDRARIEAGQGLPRMSSMEDRARIEAGQGLSWMSSVEDRARTEAGHGLSRMSSLEDRLALIEQGESALREPPTA